MARVRITRATTGKAMRLPTVRAALRERAEQVGARAQEIAVRTDYEFQYEIEEGTRPKGRPYARILSPDADQEFGTWGRKRRRILGRAVAGE